MLLEGQETKVALGYDTLALNAILNILFQCKSKTYTPAMLCNAALRINLLRTVVV
jgi:hypothetical protein